MRVRKKVMKSMLGTVNWLRLVGVGGGRGGGGGRSVIVFAPVCCSQITFAVARKKSRNLRHKSYSP